MHAHPSYAHPACGPRLKSFDPRDGWTAWGYMQMGIGESRVSGAPVQVSLVRWMPSSVDGGMPRRWTCPSCGVAFSYVSRPGQPPLVA